MAVVFGATRYHVDWPTPPPGHAELKALIGQISSNGGFEIDVVTLSSLQDELHALIARTWIRTLGTLGFVAVASLVLLSTVKTRAGAQAAPGGQNSQL